ADRQGDPYPGSNLRHRGRQDDSAEVQHRGDPVGPRDPADRRVDAADAVDGVEQNRPDGRERDRIDLGAGAEAERPNDEPYQCDLGDGASEVDERLDALPQSLGLTNDEGKPDTNYRGDEQS